MPKCIWYTLFHAYYKLRSGYFNQIDKSDFNLLIKYKFLKIGIFVPNVFLTELFSDRIELKEKKIQFPAGTVEGRAVKRELPGKW